MNKITLLVLSFIVLSCHAAQSNDVTLQEEVVNYETVADGIPIPWEWLGCRTAPCWLLRKVEFYTTLKTAQN
jgi:hypothetical protein